MRRLLGAIALVALVAIPTSATAQEPAATLDGRTIVLDPGHNGGNWDNTARIDQLVWVGTHWKPCDTLGARTNDGYRESAHNWDVALRLRKLLRAQGARVVLTRTTDTGVGPCIPRRSAIANRVRADAAVSIHADGANGDALRGFHVIVPQRVAGQSPQLVERSRRLGVAIRDALRATGPTPVSNYQGTDGLIARSDLGGLNLTTVPKVFTEIGNMRSALDAAIIASPEGRQAEAEAIARGLTRFLTGRRA